MHVHTDVNSPARGQRWTSVLAWPIATSCLVLLWVTLNGVWWLVHDVRTRELPDAPAMLARELGILVAVALVTVLALRGATRWFDRRAHPWARGRWLVPAMLVVAIPGAWQLAEDLQRVWTAVPPAMPRPAPGAETTVAAMMWGWWDGIVLARSFAPIAVLALLLHIASFVGVVRAAHWAGVATVLTVATPIVLGLTADALGCCMLAFGSDFAMYGAGTTILLALAVIGAITWTRRN